MFGRKSINGSVEWIGVTNFLRNGGMLWTLNLMSSYANLGDRGSSTGPNLGSGSEGYSKSVYINWNCPVRVLPIYHRRIFENTCSAARRTCDDILIEK